MPRHPLVLGKPVQGAQLSAGAGSQSGAGWRLAGSTGMQVACRPEQGGQVPLSLLWVLGDASPGGAGVDRKVGGVCGTEIAPKAWPLPCARVRMALPLCPLSAPARR